MQTKTTLNLIFALVVLIFAGKVGLTAYDVHRTGEVLVSTTDSTASLAISSQNTQASIIGRGTAHIRLKPGTYLLSATDQGATVAQTVDVTAGQAATVNLDIAGRVAQQSKYGGLLSQLPFSGPAFSYTISYYLKYNDGQSYPVLTISSASEQARQAALSWLSYDHYDPSSFQIDYKTEATVPNTANYYVGGR